MFQCASQTGQWDVLLSVRARKVILRGLGTMIFGFLVFGEGLNAIKIFGLIAILAGVASLRAAA